MTEPKTISYTTYLDIKFDPLALIDVSQLAKSVTDQWYNQTLCRVNDSVVRLGIMQGEYHWHKHNNDDEFFYVLNGRFIIDLEGRSVELLPNQGFVVPKGVMHCMRAPEKASSSWSRRRQLSRRATREIVHTSQRRRSRAARNPYAPPAHIAARP
jgi:uncharacterized cupin superfamily protein